MKMLMSRFLHWNYSSVIKAPLIQYCTIPNKNVNVFGLEEKDLESFVQGLYTKSDENVESTGKNLESYNNWLSKSAPAPFSGSTEAELVHPAAFGTIRFDKENPPIFESPEPNNDSQNSHEVIMSAEAEQNNSFSKRTSASNLTTRDFRMPTIITKEDKTRGEFAPENGVDVEVDAKLATGTKPIARRIPSIYLMQRYSDITHDDMWNLIKKEIIFDNEFLLAINKPWGLPAHTESRTCRHTVIDFLPELALATNCEKVFPLHRLDNETTGVLLLAKTEKAAIIIKQKFASHQIMKKYLAITKNCPEQAQGSINIPIADGEIQNTKVFRSMLKPDLSSYNITQRKGGKKDALTHFKVIRSKPDCAFLELNPETGVKHQIRVHLGLGIGCPIIGDHKYSHRDKLAPQRLSPTCLNGLKLDQSKVRYLPLHLHCSNVKFVMPDRFTDKNDHDVFVHARPPDYFMRTLRALRLK